MSNETRRGEKIGSVDFVTRYVESNKNNVYKQVQVQDLDVEHGERVWVEFFSFNSGELDKIAEYATSVYETEYRVTLRQEVVEEENIKPGQKIRAVVYEFDSGVNLADSSKVIDRVNPVKDDTSSDNIYSSLHSKEVWTYLGDGREIIKFRNPRTQSETVAMTKALESNGDEYRFSFPTRARKAIDAKPNDLIEVIRPEAPELSEYASQNKDVEEIIREMHGMMMEMYNDYMESKDD